MLKEILMRHFSYVVGCTVLLGFAGINATAVISAPDTSRCIAKFAMQKSTDRSVSVKKFDEFEEPASRIDVNKDGKISPDERIVACKTDLWSKFPA